MPSDISRELIATPFIRSSGPVYVRRREGDIALSKKPRAALLVEPAANSAKQVRPRRDTCYT
jgi:hypothetical protein